MAEPPPSRVNVIVSTKSVMPRAMVRATNDVVPAARDRCRAALLADVAEQLDLGAVAGLQRGRAAVPAMKSYGRSIFGGVMNRRPVYQLSGKGRAHP